MSQHFDIFNATFGMPANQILSLTSGKTSILSTPHSEKGFLELVVTPYSRKEPITYYVVTDGTLLSLSLGEFQLEASSWNDLAGKIMMHPPSTASFELAALFLQAGGAENYKDYFTVKLDS